MTKILALIPLFLLMLTGCTSPSTQAYTPTPTHTQDITQAQAPTHTPPQEAPIQAPVQAPSAAPLQAYQQPVLTAPPSAPVRPAQAPPAPVQQQPAPVAPAPVTCEEDMPCWDCSANDDRPCTDGVLDAPVSATPAESVALDVWDCDTSGTLQCVGTHAGIGDAWESFDAQSPAPVYDDTHVLAYSKTYLDAAPTADKHSVVIPSTNVPGAWHVFTYQQ